MSRFYSRAHYRRVSPPRDTPEQVREREAWAEAGRLAIHDRQARFPTLTPDNAGDAIRYQDDRQRFHALRLGARWPDRATMDSLLAEEPLQ